MGIPTGEVMEHGIVDLGTNFAFLNKAGLPREEAAIRLDFGLFDRVEFGLVSVRLNQKAFLMANLKLLLIRETGTVPNIAVGIENIGDEIVEELMDSLRYKRKSAFFAISKTFNLPRVHQISGHIGIGGNRFSEDLGNGNVLKGVFIGISKEFRPSFARGELTLHLETDGRGVNLGMQHTAKSGLRVNLGAEALDAPTTDVKEIRYIAGVSWSNRAIMRQINEAKRLAKQAGKLAAEAKSAVKEARVETVNE
ncbi:MAG: hypothetical protein OXI86_21380 [Candidatus Poribacteria bacterium]|nr:hypothetical protein [Candidatus Poribacteria bacterium]